MMTHRDFMEGKVTHAQYCSSVAKAAGIKFNDSELALVREALASGDEDLNSVELDHLVWPNWESLHRAFEEHEDCFWASSATYVIKQAAREAAQRNA